jgi:hypothetical protein
MKRFVFQYDYANLVLVPTVCIDLRNVEFAVGWLFWILFFFPKGEEE